MPAPLRAPARRPAGRSSEPSRVCLVCHEPVFLVGRTLMCERCAGEVAWQVKLAQSGLRFIAE